MFKVEINNIKVKSKIGVSALERKKNQLQHSKMEQTFVNNVTNNAD